MVTTTREPKTKATTERKPIQKLTRIAGVLYLAIFIVYPLSTSVRSMLVVPGDAAATAQNVMAHEPLFR